ncbi:hypothetical protein BC827DRAFT_1158503 [Russula dissimulans]|nr:hypothetical protein BC827DRAFT_1158503 [Russula dissimulans]
MSRLPEDQDPHYRSGAYHSQVPFSTIPRQPEQSTQPLSIPHDAYSHAEGRTPYRPSHQPSNYGFAGSTADYTPQQTTYNPSLGSHQFAHQVMSDGSSAAHGIQFAGQQPVQPSNPYVGYQSYTGRQQRQDIAGGSVYSHSVPPVSDSVAGSGADVYSSAQSRPGDYTAMSGHSHSLNSSRRDAGYNDEDLRGPPSPPSPVDNRAVIRFCRYPHCARHGFYDHRANMYTEWCSEHMPYAIREPS